jgi:hypothetical protein
LQADSNYWEKDFYNTMTNTGSKSSSSPSSSEEELPEDFHPSKYDVIVGWARQNYHHGK